MAFARLHYIFMFNNDQLKELVKKAREATPKRNFAQSAEITLVLKDIDVKKGFSVNEIVVLPNPTKKGSSLCMLATGDMGLRAKKADRKSTRLNSSHSQISYAVFCLKKKKI